MHIFLFRLRSYLETIKALGLRPRAFICFSVFGTPDETLALVFDILLQTVPCKTATVHSHCYITYYSVFPFVTSCLSGYHVLSCQFSEFMVLFAHARLSLWMMKLSEPFELLIESVWIISKKLLLQSREGK